MIALVPMVAIPLAADLPYCKNVVMPVPFQPQGTWTIGAAVAKSEVPVTTRSATRGLIGSRLIVNGSRAEIRTKSNRLWKKIFSTPVINQETYDTTSKEFWLDFRTQPGDLQLGRYINATDIEIGTVVANTKNQVYLNFSGIWFNLTRESSDQAP
jgi:hypothetical protein